MIHAGNSTGNHVKAVSDMKSGSFGMGLQYLLRKQQFEEDSDAIRNDERNWEWADKGAEMYEEVIRSIPKRQHIGAMRRPS